MKIYYNGKLYQRPETDTAMAISGGRIQAIGPDREILATYGKSASTSGKDVPECIDLGGQLVLPGFVDSHMHLLHDALERSYLDLSGAGSFDETAMLCRGRLPSCLAKGVPLRGTAFDHNRWDAPVLPTRHDLDRISCDIPVILQRTCHHVTICNTRALQLFDGLSRFPDGILRENAQNLLEEVLPAPGPDLIKELIRNNARRAASHGITAIYTDDLMLLPREPYGKTILDAYRQLDEAGQLPIRIVEQCNLPSMERLQAFLDAGYRTGQSSGLFTVGPLKLLGDGGIGARSAALLDEYQDDPGNRGILNFEKEEMYQLCSPAHAAGMQIAIHGIGDRAIQQILDVYEKIQTECPRPDARHGIVHCQTTRPEQLQRMANQRILAYIQPAFVRADKHIAEARLGRALLASSYDWRRMLDLGIPLSGGSDSPVESLDVLSGIWYAVTRKDPLAGPAWHPEKGLDLTEAIDLYTRGAAYAAFAEDTRGKLQPGFAADFCVLDRDITQLPPEALLETRPVMTITAGRSAYAIP